MRQKDVDQIAETVARVARFSDEHTIEGIRELGEQLARDIDYAARGSIDVTPIIRALAFDTTDN